MDAAMTGIEVILMNAAEQGDMERVSSILLQGVDVNVKDQNGMTALMHASMHGRMSVIPQLISVFRADVNTKAVNGMTALMAASFQGHKNVVSWLLMKGADPNAKATTGDTALSFARKRNHTDIMSILQTASAKMKEEG